MRLPLLVLLLLLIPSFVQAQPDPARDGITSHTKPDYAREKRWADEITPALVVGDAIYLAQKSGHKFLALYTVTPQARGAVIVASI